MKNDNIELIIGGKPEMTLYVINDFCFVDVEDLINYCKKQNIIMEDVYELSYFSTFGGKSDVIKKRNIDDCNYYTAVNKNNYLVYVKESIAFNKHMWEPKTGDISNLYKQFSNRGIEFKDDIYRKKENIFSKVKRKIKK